MTETFGARLRRLRKAAGHTLAGIGADLGLSPAYLCDVEKGKRAPLLPETIDQLVAALGADAVRDLHAVGRPESRLAASESARQAAEARLAAVEAERDAEREAREVAVLSAATLKRERDHYRSAHRAACAECAAARAREERLTAERDTARSELAALWARVRAWERSGLVRGVDCALKGP